MLFLEAILIRLDEKPALHPAKAAAAVSDDTRFAAATMGGKNKKTSSHAKRPKL